MELYVILLYLFLQVPLQTYRHPAYSLNFTLNSFLLDCLAIKLPLQFGHVILLLKIPDSINNCMVQFMSVQAFITFGDHAAPNAILPSASTSNVAVSLTAAMLQTKNMDETPT